MMTSRTLYVGNLPYRATEEEMEAFFGQIGPVESVRIVRERHTDRSRGFGFVQMQTSEDCQKALSLDGELFAGRPLKIREAEDRPPRREGNFFRRKRSFGHGGGYGSRRGGRF